jgi:tetratricopeptide (TPR) repeat protein
LRSCRVAVVLVCVAGVLGNGCAATQKSSGFAGRFVHQGKPKIEYPADLGGAAAPHESLESVIAKTRELTAKAKPPARAEVVTAESKNAQLAEALRHLAADPSVVHEVAVGEQYRRAGILDQAYDHFATAAALDRGSAAAYDGLARIWRDWRLPALGLSDAHRAVYYAPKSPEAWNTLGTILQALGQTRDATTAFSKALTLQPAASYALNNLCYSVTMAGEKEATAACQRAVAMGVVAPALRNNFGLALGLTGQFDEAREQFERAGGPAGAHYNMGVVYLTRREFKKAEEAFVQALRDRPDSRLIVQRIEQARAAGRVQEAQ